MTCSMSVYAVCQCQYNLRLNGADRMWYASLEVLVIIHVNVFYFVFLLQWSSGRCGTANWLGTGVCLCIFLTSNLTIGHPRFQSLLTYYIFLNLIIVFGGGCICFVLFGQFLDGANFEHFHGFWEHVLNFFCFVFAGGKSERTEDNWTWGKAGMCGTRACNLYA